MTILDPLTGDIKDESGNVLIPYETFRQRQCNRAIMKNESPRDVNTILSGLRKANAVTLEYDEEAGKPVAPVFAGDPGDEIEN